MQNTWKISGYYLGWLFHCQKKKRQEKEKLTVTVVHCSGFLKAHRRHQTVLDSQRHSLSHILFMPVTESWKLSSPHAHCTVPAPKTNAPLDLALYLGKRLSTQFQRSIWAYSHFQAAFKCINVKSQYNWDWEGYEVGTNHEWSSSIAKEAARSNGGWHCRSRNKHHDPQLPRQKQATVWRQNLQDMPSCQKFNNIL